jgi:two-component system sensor histidine kinase CpxA
VGLDARVVEMKLRPTLLSKVLFVAFINLLLLGAAFLLLVRFEYRLDLESFLLSPAHDRILATSRLLALQLAETETSAWDAVMERYATANRVKPRLVDDRGTVLAGDRQPLPAEVLERFLARHQPVQGPRGRGRGHDGDEYELSFLGTTSGSHWVAVPAPLPHPAGSRGDPHAWIVLASTGEDDLFYVDTKPWIAVGCSVILISIACWLPFVRGLNRSISRMTAATARVAEGHFETQLTVRRRDELGVLGASINRMASRLDRVVNGQKRFLRDAAHELRSPIARIQVALGLLDRSATAEQQATLADLREDVGHMGSLVDDVLSFSRAATRPAAPQLLSVPLAALAARVLEHEARQGVEIRTVVDEGLQAQADPELLFRAISNVVRNSIRYAGAAGPIEISAKTDRQSVTIIVADHGPGVPEKDLEAIFEPFYRLEAARERATGGVGLGLAIVKSAVEACQGTVVCRNRRPSGLEVELRFKCASEAVPAIM